MFTRSFKYILVLVTGFAAFGFVSAATVYFEPSNGDLYKNCSNTINLMLDTNKDLVLGASIKINYNSEEVEIAGFYPNKEFNLPLPVLQDDDSFTVSLLSLIRSEDFNRVGFSGKVSLGTLVLTPKGNVSSSKIAFAKTESRVREDDNDIFLLHNAADIFDGAIDGEYTFVDGNCSPVNVSGPDYLHDAAEIKDILNDNLALIDQQNKQFKLHASATVSSLKWYFLFFLILVLLGLGIYSLKEKLNKTPVKKTSKKK